MSNSDRLAARLKTAKGRTTSQQNWLRRHINDPYVGKAKDAGYRSRAAFKLIEIDAKARIFRNGIKVVDLGAAPGGWTQVMIERKAGAIVHVGHTDETHTAHFAPMKKAGAGCRTGLRLDA
jgi:23S rRNA U2552 (ribose-2'-O)-methylase RlmE/FtsJ